MTACAHCLKVHFPDAVEWLNNHETHYSRDEMETIIGNEKIAPFMVFSERKILACVEKDHQYVEGEDLSKYKTFRTKGTTYYVDQDVRLK